MSNNQIEADLSSLRFAARDIAAVRAASVGLGAGLIFGAAALRYFEATNWVTRDASLADPLLWAAVPYTVGTMAMTIGLLASRALRRIPTNPDAHARVWPQAVGALVFTVITALATFYVGALNQARLHVATDIAGFQTVAASFRQTGPDDFVSPPSCDRLERIVDAYNYSTVIGALSKRSFTVLLWNRRCISDAAFFDRINEQYARAQALEPVWRRLPILGRTTPFAQEMVRVSAKEWCNYSKTRDGVSPAEAATLCSALPDERLEALPVAAHKSNPSRVAFVTAND